MMINVTFDYRVIKTTKRLEEPALREFGRMGWEHYGGYRENAQYAYMFKKRLTAFDESAAAAEVAFGEIPPLAALPEWAESRLRKMRDEMQATVPHVSVDTAIELDGWCNEISAMLNIGSEN